MNIHITPTAKEQLLRFISKHPESGNKKLFIRLYFSGVG